MHLRNMSDTSIWKLFLYMLAVLYGVAHINEVLANEIKIKTPQKKELQLKTIQKKLKKLKPMKYKFNKKISRYIADYSKMYDVDPLLLLSILKIESNFEQSATNYNGCKYVDNKKNCGDYSIAQINFLIWQKEFKKIKNTKRYPKITQGLNIEKLKKSNKYGIETMAKILYVLKIRHSHYDSLWYTRYNSGNTLKRIRYLRLMETAFRKIKYPINYEAKEKLLLKAVKRHGWKKVMAIYTKIPSATLKL